MEKIPQKHIVYKYLRYNIQINKGGVPNERQKNKTETRAHGQTIPILALKAKKITISDKRTKYDLSKKVTLKQQSNTFSLKQLKR